MAGVWQWLEDNAHLLTISAVILACTVLLAIAIRVLVRCLVRTIRGVGGISADAHSLVVPAGLLIAAWLMPRPFIAAMRIALLLVRALAYDLPTALVATWVQSTGACRSGLGDPSCNLSIGQTISTVFQGPVAQAMGLLGVPVPAGGLKAAVAAAPTQAVPGTPIAASANFAQDALYAGLVFLAVVILCKAAIVLWRRHGTPRMRPLAAASLAKVLALTTALLVALYLCVAAIVAIPVFNDRSDRVDEGTKLLRDQLPPLAKLYADSLHTDIPAGDPFDLQPLQKRVDNIATQGGDPSRVSYAGILLTLAKQEAAAWTTARDTLQLRSKEFIAKAQLFGERMVQYFAQQNTGHVDGALTMQHETVLVGKYGAWLAEYTAGLDRCRNALLQRRSELQTWAAQLALPLEDSGRSLDPSYFWPRKQGEASAEQICAVVVPAFDDYLLPRQDVAASLLLFGQALRWLLLTESRALALIVGLLGFGFFGALAASFIRDRRAGTALSETDIIVPALIRGVAAAILIFLATFGGVAVFTRADPEPNAYAVFFACFIAAVFSEDVWSWAQRRQQAQMGRGTAGAAETAQLSLPPPVG